MTRALAIAVAVLLLAPSPAARAQAPSRAAAAEAKQHLVAGNQLYQEGRYDEAVTELLAGYGL
ncbi:MAG TPA: hypothetical protein VHB97_24990, partial [Polyangia bacterium]|nr:hypothetical protein [Polyangia bacterium]